MGLSQRHKTTNEKSEWHEPKKARTAPPKPSKYCLLLCIPSCSSRPERRYTAAVISDLDGEDLEPTACLSKLPQAHPQQHKGRKMISSQGTISQDIEDVLNDSGEEQEDRALDQEDEEEEPESHGTCEDLETEVHQPFNN